MSPENDSRLLKLDFIAECGELISSFGLAISVAAAAQNPQLAGIAMEQCRRTLLEAMNEFESLGLGGPE
jgi:hypothetical protein